MTTRTNREPGMPPERKGGTNGSRKWSEYRKGPTSDGVDFGRVESVLLLGTVSSILDSGDALLIGLTRDGGTVVITVISGDERQKWYARSYSELNDHLTEIKAFYSR